jgi:DNA polymerase-1
MKKCRLLAVDGNNLVHRAYHAIPPLNLRRTGEPVNAVFGFTSMLLRAIAEHKPDYCAVAFDRKGPTFRHLLDDGYKSNRPPTPDDLIPQLLKARVMTAQLNIPIFEVEGFEADDVLGTLAKQAKNCGLETLILTGDADSLQLVEDGVRVLYPRPGKGFSDTMLYDEAAVKDRYGILPCQLADYKALVGDTSDHYPGVRGIGEKTAARLIQLFGSIDGIYTRLEEVEPARVRELLRKGTEDARHSRVLATIVTDIPLELNLDDSLTCSYDRERITAALREMEFFSLISRLPPSGAQNGEPAPVACAVIEALPAPPDNKGFQIVTTTAGAETMAARLLSAGGFAMEPVYSGVSPMTAQLVGLALAGPGAGSFYLPLAHMGLDAAGQLSIEQVRTLMNPLLSRIDLIKSAHNVNLLLTLLTENGFEASGFSFDTMLAAHLLGDTALDLKSLALRRLGLEMPSLALGSGTRQLSPAQLEVAVVADHATLSAAAIGELGNLLTAELKSQNLWQLFSDTELPLVPLLVDMQCHGVLVSNGILGAMSQRLGGRLAEIEELIYKQAGTQFNLNSPRQLAEVLFDRLHLSPGRKTQTSRSTGADVLESLRGAAPIIDFILEYRQLFKLKSTYIDALPGLVNPRTGRIHTSFNQTRTATGRLSSSDPNLQNIPVRGDQGNEIRRSFISAEGTVLVSGDYSQIDLRALAHLSQDPLLTATFQLGADVHTATAVQLFGVEPSGVTAEMRRLAKTVNFGVIYGMSSYGLEQATELSRGQADSFIKAYFRKYPGVKEYLEKTKAQAREKGYVETILGRRRSIPDINAANRNVREAAERMAINMPVQGTSADIIKIAMLKLDDQMKKRGLASRLILQVHDELIFEVPLAELPVMRQLIEQEMSGALPLSVPLEAEVKTGRSWGELA